MQVAGRIADYHAVARHPDRCGDRNAVRQLKTPAGHPGRQDARWRGQGRRRLCDRLGQQMARLCQWGLHAIGEADLKSGYGAVCVGGPDGLRAADQFADGLIARRRARRTIEQVGPQPDRP